MHKLRFVLLNQKPVEPAIVHRRILALQRGRFRDQQTDGEANGQRESHHLIVWQGSNRHSAKPGSRPIRPRIQSRSNTGCGGWENRGKSPQASPKSGLFPQYFNCYTNAYEMAGVKP